MEEIWKDIKGYESLYQVSSLGRVKSIGNEFTRKEKILKLNPRRNGILACNLCKNGISKTKDIHQLVAIVFLNHIPNGHKLVVDHIDGNYLNNNILNLRIVTQRENLTTCFRKDRELMTSKYIGVSKDKCAKNWSANIMLNGKGIYLGSFSTDIEAYSAYQNALKNHVV